jgi:hypothetical protein
MAIKLWQRKQGFMAPAGPIHAEDGSHQFPVTFRTRVLSWATGALVDCEWSTGFGEVVNPREETLEALFIDLAEAYGRELLVPPAEMKSPVASTADVEAPRQLRYHVARCSDFEVLDFIDATVQKVVELLTATVVVGDIQEDINRITQRFNDICGEEGIGYRWSKGELIRFDSAAIHELAVEPAMVLLAEQKYANADAEFRRALECYRSGHWRDAITNANAAFESVLKIATGRSSGTAGSLIADTRQQGLIPAYGEAAAENLEKLMNLVPAIRGQQGSSHGLGDRAMEADEHLAQLVVAAAAAFMVFVARPID